MKILLPVSFITLASGFCCCCGGDMSEVQTEIQKLTGGSSTEVTVTSPPQDGGPTTMATGGSELGGTCGTFKDSKLTLPSGFKVSVCASMGDTQSLVAEGSGDLKAACGGVKSWATGIGYKVNMESGMGDTTAIILEKGAQQMTVSCTSVTGKPTISLSITNK